MLIQHFPKEKSTGLGVRRRGTSPALPLFPPRLFHEMSKLETKKSEDVALS